MRNMPKWQNVGGAGGDGSAYFGIGARMLNNAGKALEGAATNHDNNIREMELKAKLEATAKLAEKARENGGKLSKKDYESVGAYDPKMLDNLLKTEYNRVMDENNLELDRRRTAAQIAHWQNADSKILSPEEKLALYGAKRKLDAMYGVGKGRGKSKSSKKGKSGSASGLQVLNKFLKENEITDSMDMDHKLEKAAILNKLYDHPDDMMKALEYTGSSNNFWGTIIPFLDEFQFGDGLSDPKLAAQIKYNRLRNK